MGSIDYYERFIEFDRIRRHDGYSKKTVVLKNATFDIKDEWGQSPELYDFFKSCGVAEVYLQEKDGVKLVDKILSQLVLIEYLVDEGMDTVSLKALGVAVRKASERERYKPLLNWNDSGMVIAYLHKMNIKNWPSFLVEAEFDWKNFNVLQKAFSVLEVGFEDVLNYLKRLNSATDLNGSSYQVSVALIEKLSVQPELAAKFDKELEMLISEKYIEDFMPAIITGLVGGKAENFDRLLDRLKDLFDNHKLFLLLWAFGRCCPVERRVDFQDVTKAKFYAGQLDKVQYLKLCGFCKFVGDDLIELVTEHLDSEDFEVVYEYVYNLVESEHSKEWYRLAAIKLFTVDEPSYKGQMNHFLYTLCEHNLELVYELLTKRFEVMGDQQLLDDNLDHIIDLDHERFQLNLTRWFNSEYRNVHKAMLGICTKRNSSAVYKVSQIYFRMLTAEEKVYICIKIAGFVYSMEHLQSLLFSVLEAALPEDDALLTNLYWIFDEYLVYNYRSTLDMIKERLKSTDCPAHQKGFLQSIDDNYENYFNDLNKVRLFKELQSDAKLEEFTRFYRSQLFAASMKESNKKGFLSMMKSVDLHAKKWAIRRREEKIHQVTELALIEQSFEFPSGEKLDPTRQESLRRNFQIIQKHEINFS